MSPLGHCLGCAVIGAAAVVTVVVLVLVCAPASVLLRLL